MNLLKTNLLWILCPMMGAMNVLEINTPNNSFLFLFRFKFKYKWKTGKTAHHSH